MAITEDNFQGESELNIWPKKPTPQMWTLRGKKESGIGNYKKGTVKVLKDEHN